MSTFLRRPLHGPQLWAMWGSVLAERRQAGRLWPLGLLAGMLLLGLPAALGWWADGLAAVIGLWSGMVVLCLTAGIALVTNALQQNRPMLARLLPGHVPALRRALWGAAAWLLLLLMLPLAGLALVHTARPVPLAMVTALCITGAAGLLAVLTLSMRWPAMALLWVLLPMGTVLGDKGLAALASGYVAGGPWLWFGVALLAVAALAACLHAVMMNGGPRHRAAQQRMPHLRNGLAGPLRGEDAVRQWGVTDRRWVDRLTGVALYRQLLQWQLSSRQRRGGMPAASMGQGMPPDLQPLGMLALRLPSLLLWLALALLVGVGLQGSAMQAAFRPAALGACCGSSLALLMYLRIVQAMRCTRGEQALQCLLPGAPQRAVLNRWLARRLAAVALVQVAMSALTAACALLLMREPAGPWWQAVGSAVVLSLAGLPLLWRNWSRVSAGKDAEPMARVVVPLLLLLGLHLAVMLAWPRSLPALWALDLAGGAAWAVWRWHRLAHEPAAWPVGHRGTLNRIDKRP